MEKYVTYLVGATMLLYVILTINFARDDSTRLVSAC